MPDGYISELHVRRRLGLRRSRIAAEEVGPTSADLTVVPEPREEAPPPER